MPMRMPAAEALAMSANFLCIKDHFLMPEKLATTFMDFKPAMRGEADRALRQATSAAP